MENDTILSNYDLSFVEDYDKWKTLVSEINAYIPIYLESMSLVGLRVPKYTYNNFCQEYKKEVGIFLSENAELSRESVHYILDLLVKNKIIKSLIENDIQIPDNLIN